MEMSRTEFKMDENTRRALAALMAIAAVVIAVGFYLAPQRIWTNLLLNSFFFVSLALGAALFVAILHVSNSGWGIVLRRIPEAMMGFLPLGALTTAILYFGLNSLYPWANPTAVLHDEILRHRAAYQNPLFFMLRLGVCFVVWIVFTEMMARASRRQDDTGDLRFTRRNVAYAAAFIPVFAITYSIASFDWIMSLEARWASTIFAIYTFSGLFVSSIAAITLLTLHLRRQGFLPQINANHLHTLGKLMFAFSTFWAYIWISQYLLIWYANIPEEALYFIRRTSNGGWKALFFINIFLNWVIPFLLLMPRANKRKEKALVYAAGFLLLGRWIDLFTMIFPVFYPWVQIGIYEVMTFTGFVAIFCWMVARKLKAGALIPLRDPYLSESLQLHL